MSKARLRLVRDVRQRVSMPELLEASSVVDILPQSRMPLVTIPAAATVQQALTILSLSKVTSAPIYDASLNLFYGFFEFYDLLTHLLKTFVGKTPETDITDQQWRSYAGDLAMLQFKGTSFANLNILALLTTTPRAHTLEIGAPLPRLVARLANEHRVIVDAGGLTTFSLATQLDLIRFLASNINHFDRELMEKSVMNLGLGLRQNVHPVRATKMTIGCFYLMWQEGIPCVPVVDVDGRLLANLSITDLKAVGQENFGSLLSPVEEFIHEQVFNPKLPPLAIPPQTSLSNCLLFFAACGVHHLWVTDSGNRPTGVISAGDVVRTINEILFGRQE